MSRYDHFDPAGFTATGFGLSVGAGTVLAASTMTALADLRQRTLNARAAKQQSTRAYQLASIRLANAWLDDHSASQELLAALQAETEAAAA